MENIKNCPICESTEQTVFLKSRNFRVNAEKFDVMECNSCTFRYTSPLPSMTEIGEYYDPQNYVSHTGTKKGLINKLFHSARFFTLRNKYKLLSKVSKGKRHLDIGAGNGVFLSFMQEKGWDVSGVELDDASRARIVENTGLPIAKFVQDNSETEEYDVITMWHVLEHVYELKKDIKTIKEKLKKNGALIVAVPNCASYDAKKYKEFWAAYDLPIHLYHFRPQNIKDLFAQYNMEVVETKPMKFDSFYISLISEKYKNNQKGGLGAMIKGFWFGLISNLKAKNGEYSSQIYVIKNKCQQWHNESLGGSEMVKHVSPSCLGSSPISGGKPH